MEHGRAEGEKKLLEEFKNRSQMQMCTHTARDLLIKLDKVIKI